MEQEHFILPSINGFKVGFSTDPRILLILLAFCEKNIVRYFVHIFSMLPVIGLVSDAIIPLAYTLLFIAYIQKYRASFYFEESCVLLFFVFSIYISCIVFPENAKYILEPNNFWNSIFRCLRYYIIGIIFIPNKETMDVLGKASCLAIIVESLFVVFYMMPRGLLSDDDMSRSYQLLPNVLFAISYTFSKKNIFSWLCSILGCFYILSMGSRGPVIIILTYIYLKIVESTLSQMWEKITVAVLGIGAVTFFLETGLYLSMLLSLNELVSKLGLSTRVIDLAIYGEITTHYSGRDELYAYAIQKILENPIGGYGVYGEWPWFHWNAHNMYLELLIHYGVIVGSIILLWMVLLVARSYFKSNNVFAKDLILICICFVFVRGIFGGSYLFFGTFFMIGCCMAELRRIKCRTREKMES